MGLEPRRQRREVRLEEEGEDWGGWQASERVCLLHLLLPPEGDSVGLEGRQRLQPLEDLLLGSQHLERPRHLRRLRRPLLVVLEAGEGRVRLGVLVG